MKPGQTVGLFPNTQAVVKDAAVGMGAPTSYQKTDFISYKYL